jgi:hypothetical protein
MDAKSWASCKFCRIRLADDHTGPCPSCGKEGKDINIFVSDRLKAGMQRHETVRKKPFRRTVILAGSPVLGFLIAGPGGLLAGIAVAVLYYFLSSSAEDEITTSEKTLFHE